MSTLIGFSLNGVDVPLVSPTFIPIVGVTAAALLYLRACSVLETRGRHVPMSQRVCYFLALGFILIATQSFIDPVGEDSLVSLHMLQHMLIADMPAPLLLYGLRAPVLFFFWPRPILVTFARMQWLRRAWGWLRRPQVAIVVWLVALYAWHMPPMYAASINHRVVHDLQHISFAVTGIIIWWPLIDPSKPRVESRLWKIAYLFGARFAGGVLGLLMMAWKVQLYPVYGDASLQFGLSPLDDQKIAGVIMMSIDAIIVIVGCAYFFWTLDSGAEYDDDLPEAARQAALEAHPDAQRVLTAPQ